MAQGKSAKKSKSIQGFTDEERAAVRELVQERKAGKTERESAVRYRGVADIQNDFCATRPPRGECQVRHRHPRRHQGGCGDSCAALSLQAMGFSRKEDNYWHPTCSEKIAST
jgi:hypothetical protein